MIDVIQYLIKVALFVGITTTALFLALLDSVGLL